MKKRVKLYADDLNNASSACLEMAYLLERQGRPVEETRPWHELAKKLREAAAEKFGE